MNNIPEIKLRDGRAMPQLGFGVWQVPNEEVSVAVQEALKAGYRSIDTAAIYGNEEGVGAALRASGIPREQLTITTKLWNDRHRDAEAALAESLQRLQLDYLDLYLIHWPSPKKGDYLTAWKSLAQLQTQGLVRSIGVSNFTEAYLQRLFDETGIVPVVNQVELHPTFQQRALREFHAKHNIVTESWSPLGQGKDLHDPVIAGIAQRLGKTSAQVVLRWHIESGLMVIPKSVTSARIHENRALFDFTLTADDHAAIGRLDTTERYGFDPERFS